MASLKTGVRFSSYEELKVTIDEYQIQNSIHLRIRNSKSLEAANLKERQVKVNEDLKYSELSYVCSDCHKNKNWFKSIKVQFDCEMNIRVVATKDGQHLEVRRMDEKHNHPIGAASKLPPVASPRKRPSNLKREDTVQESESSSPGQTRKRTKSSADSISLGKQGKRWQGLKERLNVLSDEELAEILIDHFEQLEELHVDTQTSQVVHTVPSDLDLSMKHLPQICRSQPLTNYVKTEENTSKSLTNSIKVEEVVVIDDDDDDELVLKDGPVQEDVCVTTDSHAHHGHANKDSSDGSNLFYRSYESEDIIIKNENESALETSHGIKSEWHYQ